MEKLVINGPTRLKGDVNISGAKNAAVAIIPATLLIDGECTLKNHMAYRKFIKSRYKKNNFN